MYSIEFPHVFLL